MEWQWVDEQELEFQWGQGHGTVVEGAHHSDPDLGITLASNRLSYGLGAVLSHRMLDGQERPITYALRSLTKAERQHAQIEREDLALYWGYEIPAVSERASVHPDNWSKTFKYIMNQGESSFGDRRSEIAALMGAFSYQIEYRSTTQHSNYDSLFHLPLQKEGEDQQGKPMKWVFLLQYH